MAQKLQKQVKIVTQWSINYGPYTLVSVVFVPSILTIYRTNDTYSQQFLTTKEYSSVNLQ